MFLGLFNYQLNILIFKKIVNKYLLFDFIMFQLNSIFVYQIV
jgi:hypothetical protein